jgi:DNA-binding NarL/FixJ family response regulator
LPPGESDPLHPESHPLADDELDSITREVAVKTGGQVALFGVWAPDEEAVEVISAWGTGGEPDDLVALLPADGFVGRVLKSGQALVESVDLGIAASGAAITHVAGAPIRKPGGPSAVLCVGFSSPPENRELTLWMLESYGRIASVHLLDLDQGDESRGQLKLLIVDDHEVVRDGLTSALASDQRFEIVGAAGNAQEAVQLARRTTPDVAILDMYLPDVSGDELCVRLRGLLPSLSVIVVSSYLTEEAVRRAASAGAAAYVTKAAGLPELRATLDRIWANRGQPIDESSVPQIVKSLENLVKDRSGDDRAPTPQQARVLELAAEGMTYYEIAERLMISQSTVRFHIQKLKVKFGTNSKTDLIVQCIRLGVIAPPSNEAGTTGI